MAGSRHRIGYSAAYLLTAWPEVFGRHEGEQPEHHVQRLAAHPWLIDATDAELAAIADTRPDLVARVRDRMARDLGTARLLRLAREARHAVEAAHLEATGELEHWPSEAEIIRQALEEWRERRVNAIRERALVDHEQGTEAA